MGSKKSLTEDSPASVLRFRISIARGVRRIPPPQREWALNEPSNYISDGQFELLDMTMSDIEAQLDAAKGKTESEQNELVVELTKRLDDRMAELGIPA